MENNTDRHCNTPKKAQFFIKFIYETFHIPNCKPNPLDGFSDWWTWVECLSCKLMKLETIINIRAAVMFFSLLQAKYKWSQSIPNYVGKTTNEQTKFNLFCGIWIKLWPFVFEFRINSLKTFHICITIRKLK